MNATARTYRTCPLCEATCGLEITTAGDEVLAVRPDHDDVFSHGFICPKGVGLKELHDDPDRLRTPMLRQADGSFASATWDEAFAEIDRRLPPILEAHGRDAVGAYLGNPAAHNLGPIIYGRALLRALGSKNVFSASTVDQMPKHVSAGLMFGGPFRIPVPDLDRTEHLLIFGADPMVSNGSLMTAPDARGRLRQIQARGGKIVVFDPRRSRTAEVADEHHFIRPGTDAQLLFAIVAVLFEEDLISTGALAGHCNGIDEVRELSGEFTPEAVAPLCGIAPDEIRRVARELAAADRAAVYGRIGTCTQEFGTLASWLVDVVNVLTGNLDRPGGALFPRPVAGGSPARDTPGPGRGTRFGRWQSRVRGLGEVLGELPVSCLAEEIETPGEGQIRALITIAGNPALSTPNSGRLDRALDALEFMVSVDIYLNETTSHADVVLPAPAPLERSHYDLALYQFAIRSVANYSPPVFEADMPAEWQTLLRLAGVVAGQGPDVDVEAFDTMVALEMARREASAAGSPIAGRDPGEIVAALAPRVGPERILDLLVRVGPFGEGLGEDPDGLTLAALEASPHGIDCGPLESRVPDALLTPSAKIELAPEPIVADVDRLRASLGRHVNGAMVLIGRRQQRSNNSWMHNLPLLVKGKPRCTARLHPDDAARFGLEDGGPVRVTSRAGTVEVPVEVTEAIMPGVVSIPHGWGHDAHGMQMAVASDHAGVNSNILADEAVVDPLSGNAVLNGIPVELAAVHAPLAAPATP